MYQWDASLTIQTPAATDLPTAATSWREEQINPEPSQSTNSIGPLNLIHCKLQDLQYKLPYSDEAICNAAGVRMMIIMVGKIRNAMGRTIFTGAL